MGQWSATPGCLPDPMDRYGGDCRLSPRAWPYLAALGRRTPAEYATAREKRLAAKPASLSFEQAAAVPISGVTALQAVRDSGRVQPEQQVMVIGAAGGVGSFAVQIAKASGARVTGVCSSSEAGLVLSIDGDAPGVMRSAGGRMRIGRHTASDRRRLRTRRSHQRGPNSARATRSTASP